MYAQAPRFTPRVPLSLFLFIIACLSVGTETSHSRIADSRPPPTTTHSYIRMWKWSDAAISRLGNGVTSGFDKAVAFSPDENHVAFVSGNSIWIHDIKTASRLTQPKGGHVSSIKSLAYSPDGLILAAGTGGGQVQLWEVKSGRLLDLLTRNEPASAVDTLTFSPDGNILASGTKDEIKLWDIKIRGHLATLQDRKHRIVSLAFSPDGKSLASRAEHDNVILWEVATGKKLAALKYPRHVADVYDQVTRHFNTAKLAATDVRKTAIEDVIAEFQNIIKTYAGTKYSDLALVQIGEAYMMLADEADEYWNDALDYFDRLWVKYADAPPVDAQVAKALRYAQSQVAAITSFMESNNIHRHTTGGSD